MTDKIFKIKLRQLLANSSRQIQKGFALQITENLLHNYGLFTIQHNWGDFQLLTECLNYCKVANSDNISDLDKLMVYRQQISKHIPDSEDFSQTEASLALNAGTALEETLDFILDNDVNRLMDISTFSIDTVDFKNYELIEKSGQTEAESQKKIQDEYEYQLNLCIKA